MQVPTCTAGIQGHLRTKPEFNLTANAAALLIASDTYLASVLGTSPTSNGLFFAPTFAAWTRWAESHGDRVR